MKLNHFLFILMAFLSLTCKAQDPVFTQFYLVPETLNPAFTGIGYGLNAGIIHRRQWPDANKRIDTQYGFVSNVPTNSDQIGLGLSVLNHNEVFTHYNFSQLNGNFSYSIDLDGYQNWRLRFGVEAGIGYKDFKFGNLLLEDQISLSDGTINPTTADPFGKNLRNVYFFDLSTGFALVQQNAWVGATLRHLNRPNIAFTEGVNAPLDLFLSLHGGYYLDFNSPILPEHSMLLLTANYMRQGRYNRLDIGGNVELKKVSLGLIAATNPEGRSDNSHFLTSINPVVYVKWKQFVFGYSYDISTSKIGNTQGVHELTITWLSEHSCGPKCDNYKVRLKRNGEGGYEH